MLALKLSKSTLKIHTTIRQLKLHESLFRLALKSRGYQVSQVYRVFIWEYARANDFVIVSKDSDFHQRSLLYGHPPKFVYLRIGNSPTSKIVQILRDHFDIITQFGVSELESILVLG
jgi:predicted nuclease of predicted toxin-antitoxin system